MIITTDQLKIEIKDSNITDNDLIYMKSAQEIVESYLGYKIEQSNYVYDDEIHDDYIILNAPNITISSIKYNGIDITDYKIKNYWLEFPYILNGDLEIDYSAGYILDDIPASIIHATLQIAKAKHNNSKQADLSSYSIPNGVNNNFVGNENTTSFNKYLYPLYQYRIIQ